MNKVFITDTFLQYIYHITSTQDTQQTLLHFPVQSQQQGEWMIIHLKRPQNCICSNTHTAFDGAILRGLKISSDEREIGWNGEKCQYNNGRYEDTGGCNKMSLSSCLVPHRFIGTRSTPSFCACFARSNKQRGSPILPKFSLPFLMLCVDITKSVWCPLAQVHHFCQSSWRLTSVVKTLHSLGCWAQRPALFMFSRSTVSTAGRAKLWIWDYCVQQGSGQWHNYRKLKEVSEAITCLTFYSKSKSIFSDCLIWTLYIELYTLLAG